MGTCYLVNDGQGTRELGSYEIGISKWGDPTAMWRVATRGQNEPVPAGWSYGSVGSVHSCQEPAVDDVAAKQAAFNVACE